MLYMIRMKFYYFLGAPSINSLIRGEKSLIGKKNAGYQWMTIIYGTLGSMSLRDLYKGSHCL